MLSGVGAPFSIPNGVADRGLTYRTVAFHNLVMNSSGEEWRGIETIFWDADEGPSRCVGPQQFVSSHERPNKRTPKPNTSGSSAWVSHS